MFNVEQTIIILVFLVLISIPFILLGRLIRISNRYPQREREPKPGDKYFSEVFTRTAFGSGRILTIQFHPTLEEANTIVKKNAVWFDAYGGVHQDVGIYWNVGVLTQEILEKMRA